MDPESAPRIPRHIAIVMDGNGRWAERRRRPRSFGHREGQKAVRAAVEFCLRRGVEALTLFAFSSENWNRPQSEVGALMQLFLKALDREVDELHENGVRIAFVGDLSAFQPELRERMQNAMTKTGANAKLKLNIAVNYGGRWDIADAARRAALEVAAGRLRAEDITEQSLAPFFCLADLPAVDLFIRLARGEEAPAAPSGVVSSADHVSPAPTADGKVTTYKVLYWQEIPSQIKAEDDAGKEGEGGGHAVTAAHDACLVR